MIFNVRTPESDPRVVLRRLEPRPIAFKAERASEYCRLQPTGRGQDKAKPIQHGPLTRELIELVVAREGHRQLGVTVRKEPVVVGEKPAALKRWHTDFARNRTREQCTSIRNYLLVSEHPGTCFLQASNVDLVNAHTIPCGLPTFQIEPWTLVCYNATEVHTSAIAEATANMRYFFRATVDTIHF